MYSVLRKLNSILMPSSAHTFSAEKKPTRYDTLRDVFEHQTARKQNILEIGTYNGNTAVALITIAKRYEPPEAIHYYGFDLFEHLDEETLRREHSKKPSRTMDAVRAFIIGETGISQKQVHLYQGFTHKTLWENLPGLPKMDFIFIDGGHSFETVENDWRACKELMSEDTVVVFDDYYQFEYGPRIVIDNLDTVLYDIEFLQPQEVFQDRFGISPEGVIRINMVEVRLK